MKNTHPSAQGLASLGRYGDSMLVHMSPEEVSGLQSIAMAQGGSLTVNPHTGLPEAFSVGNFFRSLAPTIVGAATAPFLGPFGATLAGAATGAALNRDNPLMGAVTGGLGGYGGAGLQKAGAAALNAGTAAAPTVSTGTGLTVGKTVSGLDPTGVSGFKATLPEIPTQQTLASVGGAGVGGGVTGLGTDLGIGGGAAPVAPVVQQTPLNAYVESLGGTGKNAGLMAAAKTAAPLGMAYMAGYEPPKMEEDKYDPRATLNLSGDTGLRLLATGGDVNFTPLQYKDDRTPTMGDSPYGLSSLRSDGPMRYARGGYLDGAGDGMSDSIHATIEGKQPARLADGEFVIPADVVSHLGNGSTKAGAKRLYAMMDKVRQARTGTKKQGRQINAHKYLPA